MTFLSPTVSRARHRVIGKIRAILLAGSICVALPAPSPLSAAAGKDDLSGDWTGEVDIVVDQLRVLFRVTRYPNGNHSATLSLPDKSELPLPVTVITCDDRDVRIDVDSIGGRYRGRLNHDGTRIRGEWSQGDYTADLDLEKAEGGFAQDRPQTPNPPFPYTVEEVTFANEFANLQLAGTLTLPEDNRPGRPLPAVVLVSDAGPHDRDARDSDHLPFAVLADHLTRQGIAVLRYDDRGVGKSEGHHEFSVTLDFATDAWAAVDYLSKRRDIDPGQIGLLGHGEGAWITSVVAGKRDDIAFIVMLAASAMRGDATLVTQNSAIAQASGVSEATRDLLIEFSDALYALLLDDPAAALANAERLGQDLEKRVAALPPEDAAKLLEVGLVLRDQIASLESESPWFPRYVAHDPVPSIAALDCPLLVLYAEHDLEVPPSAHQPAMEGLLKDKPTAEIHVMRGLNHRFQSTDNGAPSAYGTLEETFAPTTLRAISGWIAEHVRR